jgi:hypothetical protein
MEAHERVVGDPDRQPVLGCRSGRRSAETAWLRTRRQRLSAEKPESGVCSVSSRTQATPGPGFRFIVESAIARPLGYDRALASLLVLPAYQVPGLRTMPPTEALTATGALHAAIQTSIGKWRG